MAWIGLVLVVDAVHGTQEGLGLAGGPPVGGTHLDGPGAWSVVEWARQVALGAGTWIVLAAALRREPALVRAQTLIVVLLATLVEYTFSPGLEAYVYRVGTVPFFVPPGHGLVYLAAALLGRALLASRRDPERARRRLRAATGAVLALGGAWALAGLLGVFSGGHPDHLGAFWFVCLAGFLVWGPSRALYVGAFAVVSYLELIGTALGTWAWAPYDPVLGVIGQGNPPSGAAGGYGWFDLYALLLAPGAVRAARRLRAVAAQLFGRPAQLFGRRRASTSSCSSPLVATALPPNGPSVPSSELNRPPASTTIGTSAAMSYTASSGSQAMSTAPSATSMYDQKSP